jgi:hypothetical protein
MAARKARKPTAGRSARRLHAVSAAGELKDREANPRKLEPQARGDSMPVDAIRVGHRHRKDMGDLAELVTNTKDSAAVCSIALQYGVPVTGQPQRFNPVLMRARNDCGR